MTVQASAPSPASSAEPAGRATALTFVKERGRLGGIGVVLIAYLLFSNWVAHGTLFTQSLIIDAAIFAILAVSVDIVAGMTGLYSLGHAGLFALGAYATTLLHNDHGISVFLLLPISIVGVGLVGLVLGALSLRVTGLYFAITTFIFTLVVAVMASDFSFTGGEQGLVGPEFPHFGAALSGLGSAIVWAVMLALLLVVLITLGLRRSPLYPILLAIRDAEPFAAAAGVRTSLMKVALCGLSASMAGLAGWLFSFQGIISPSQFSWSVSVNILVMVILGGINTTLGPIIGAAFVSMFPDYVNISPFWQEVMFGGIFVAVIILFPSGAVGLLRSLGELLLRRLGLMRAAAPPLDGDERHAFDPLELSAAASAVEALAESAGRVESEQRGAAVECRDIVFSYGTGVRVLDHVDFVVKRGTIHGLIGPNGSGKSTLVNLIGGRLRPSSGTIAIDQANVEREGPPSRARHGLMRTFQAAVLVRELPARENVLVGMYSRVPRIATREPIWPLLRGARRDARRMRTSAGEALDRVGAGRWAQARIGDVPHGVAQLTQLAAVSVAGPRTIVLDEPLAGLSPGEVEHVGEILAELKRQGVSIVLVEHQPRFVFALCDEVTVLDAGEVVASGPAAEVREDTRVREVYLGQ